MLHRHLPALLVPTLMSSCAAVSNTSTFVYTRPLAVSHDEKLAAMEGIYAIWTAIGLTRTCDVQSDKDAALSLDFNWALSVGYNVYLVDLRTPDHPRKSLWSSESGFGPNHGVGTGDLYYQRHYLWTETSKGTDCHQEGNIQGVVGSLNGGYDAIIAIGVPALRGLYIEDGEVKGLWEQPDTFLEMNPHRVALLSEGRLFLLDHQGHVLHTFKADPGESFTGEGKTFLKLVDQNTILYFKTQDKKLDVCTFNVETQKSNCMAQTQVKTFPDAWDAVVSLKSKQVFLPQSTVLQFALPE